MSGKDKTELLDWEMMIFHPKRENYCTIPRLSLQPLPEELDSKALFDWGIVENDSVFIIDNRYGYLTGAWKVLYFDRRVDDMLFCRNADSIYMSKITLWGDNWVPLVVPE